MVLLWMCSDRYGLSALLCPQCALLARKHSGEQKAVAFRGVTSEVGKSDFHRLSKN